MVGFYNVHMFGEMLQRGHGVTLEPLNHRKCPPAVQAQAATLDFLSRRMNSEFRSLPQFPRLTGPNKRRLQASSESLPPSVFQAALESQARSGSLKSL